MTSHVRYHFAAEDFDEKVRWFRSLTVAERLACAEQWMQLVRLAAVRPARPKEGDADRAAYVVRLPRRA
jgi:hypothetical protein